MDSLRLWWRQRELRERRLLGIGAVVCVLLLGWAFVWHPLVHAREQLRQRLAAQTQDLAFMSRARDQLQTLTRRDARGHVKREGKSLLALADASARSNGLAGAVKRIEPQDAKHVRVELQLASFDALMNWMQGLARDYGIQATDLSMDRADGVGQVNARVTLQEP